MFENAVRGLREMGAEVFVYQRHNDEIAAFSAPEKLGVVFSAYYSARTARDIRNIIREHKPDVALVQNVFPLLSPSVYFALAEAGTPIIQAVYNYRLVCPSAELFTEGAICERCVAGNTAHAVIHRCYRGSYAQSAWYASIIGWHRSIATFADKITSFMVPDNFLGSKLAQGGIPRGKIWRNPNPFFVEDYEQQPAHRGYVLYVGRFVRQKGILTLLSAMELSASNSRLVLVGGGELAGEVQARINSPKLFGRVTWSGVRWGEEVKALIRDCAAVVIPSEWYDNLPMILCRANAMGKPVIASRIDGIPEYVDEGKNGYLFEPGNTLELAGVIDKVAGLPRAEYARISATVRNFAEEVFDYRHHYRNLADHIAAIRGEIEAS